MNTKGLLIEHLNVLRRREQKRLFLSEEAKVVLRSFFKNKQSHNKQESKSNVLRKEPLLPIKQQRAVADERELKKSLEKERSGGGPVRPYVSSSPSEQLGELFEQMKSWKGLKEMKTLREKIVYSSGSVSSSLMFVGEAPGYHEEQQGRPFLGASGEKLDAILSAMGLDREKVYLTYLCKQRPRMKNQTMNNRKPHHQEVEAYLPFFQAELELVKPKVLVSLGGGVAEVLLGKKGSVASFQGQWHRYHGVALRITQHPSYLLHNQTALLEKRAFWEEMMAVMEALEMPISEKQSRIFLKK